MNCKEFLEGKELTDLKPRLRCVSCRRTVAEIYDNGKGNYLIIDGQWLDCCGSEDYCIAIDKTREGWICGECLEFEETEPAVSGTLCVDAEKYNFKIGEYVIMGADLPMLDEIIIPYAQSIRWMPTDPWRGGFATRDFDKWKKVIDDWFGTLDGYNCDRGDLGKFYALYEQKGEVPNFPMLVAFPRTSNLCSCGIECYVPPDAKDNFKKWLGVKGLEIEN